MRRDEPGPTELGGAGRAAELGRYMEFKLQRLLGLLDLRRGQCKAVTASSPPPRIGPFCAAERSPGTWA